MLNSEICETTIRESLAIYFDFDNQECVLRQDFHKPHLKQKYLQCLTLETLVDFTLTCLELVNNILVHKEKESINHKFHLQYWKIFNDLQQPKDELVGFVLIVVWFLIHSTLYKLAQGDDKLKYDFRFMYNEFHILIYYSNGVYVSDDYVKMQIDNYLHSRYLDYRLNYIQKKNLKTRLQTSSTNLFPVLNPPDLSQIPGGPQFQRDIRNKKRIGKPIELMEPLSAIDDVHYSTDRFPSSIKFDLNQLSPSISKLIHSNNTSPKTSFITHQVMSPQLSNFNITRELRNLQVNREFSQTARTLQYTQNQKILDLYRVPQPPLDYYKKNPKVDHLFKDMLDMKLILQQSRQNLKPSSRMREDGSAIRERIRLILHEKQESNNLLELQKSQVKFNNDEMTSTAYNSTILTTTQNTSRRPSVQDKLEIHQLKSQSKQTSPQNTLVYQDKRKIYQDKYSKFNNGVPIDTKINDLQHNLQFNKHLATKHHKKKQN